MRITSICTYTVSTLHAILVYGCACAHSDEAVVEVHADQRRSDAGVVPERGGDGLLHDGLGGGARPVVEAEVEAGGGRREQRRQERGEA